MYHLLRVALPDVPGSLGRLASAIGAAGGNIDAIEIVERTGDGRAVDDVFLATDSGVMPDSIVSACNGLLDVDVLWISRYAAASNITRDLEVVEAMTAEPAMALDRLVDLLPATFIVDWAARVRRAGAGAELLHRTSAAPRQVPSSLRWPTRMSSGSRLPLSDEHADLLLAGCPLGDDQLVVVGRRGGPEILDSEIARLGHLVSLAESIARQPGDR
ncbi:MAG: ACT domain-containing protein [Actinomycetota bacterium]|nr:ACT domain-containing protein [Actinomycetota bacterium]